MVQKGRVHGNQNKDEGTKIHWYKGRKPIAGWFAAEHVITVTEIPNNM